MSGPALAESSARIAEAARSGDFAALSHAEAHVARLVADAPPLTGWQRSVLADVLGGAR